MDRVLLMGFPGMRGEIEDGMPKKTKQNKTKNAYYSVNFKTINSDERRKLTRIDMVNNLCLGRGASQMSKPGSDVKPGITQL